MGSHCSLTGKGVRYGHNVSHSNRKTSRRFHPNIQRVSLRSDALGATVRLNVSTRALRSVQKRGGLDGFLLGMPDAKLPPEAQRLKHRIRRALG